MNDEQSSDFCNLEVMAEAERYNAFLSETVRKAAGTARRLLDFGAGSGTFAEVMRSAGYEVTCVETEAALRARLTHKGFDARADMSGFPAGALDFAYTLNVLEHIDDDIAALRDIAAALKPGGRILVYVPAFMILFTSMDRKVHHLRRYRRRDLMRRLEAAGFSVERAEYVDSIGFPVTLLYRFLGNRSGRINLTLLRIYDRLLFPVSRALDRITCRLFGKNVLVVAVKTAVA